MPRRFKAQDSTIKNALRIAFERMDVGTRYDIKEYGNGLVKIAFVRQDEDGKDREYQFICDAFDHPADNLRACERSITYLWRIYEDYMVRTTDVDYKFGTIFAGFQVTEGQKVLMISDGNKPCWDQLGLPKDATIDEIKKQYRALQKTNHPDKGGDPDEFKRIESAYQEFMDLKA